MVVPVHGAIVECGPLALSDTDTLLNHYHSPLTPNPNLQKASTDNKFIPRKISKLSEVSVDRLGHFTAYTTD